MSNNMPASENDFNSSLVTISKLRRSSFVSILLMVFGIVIVTSSLFISVFNLSSYKSLWRGRYSLGSPVTSNQIGQIEQIENLSNQLQTAKQQSLELIIGNSEIGAIHSGPSRPSNNARPRIIRPRPTPFGPIDRSNAPNTKPDSTSIKEGWAYYGHLNKDGDWDRIYFNSVSYDDEIPLMVGNRITPSTTIYLREGYIHFDPAQGWVHGRKIAEIEYGMNFKVLSIHKILDRYYWVKITEDRP